MCNERPCTLAKLTSIKIMIFFLIWSLSKRVDCRPNADESNGYEAPASKTPSWTRSQLHRSGISISISMATATRASRASSSCPTAAGTLRSVTIRPPSRTTTPTTVKCRRGKSTPKSCSSTAARVSGVRLVSKAAIPFCPSCSLSTNQSTEVALSCALAAYQVISVITWPIFLFFFSQKSRFLWYLQIFGELTSKFVRVLSF